MAIKAGQKLVGSPSFLGHYSQHVFAVYRGRYVSWSHMKFTKYVVLSIVCMSFYCNSALAEWTWTDNRWDGQGIEVTYVYPDWNQKWISFRSTDGLLYFYPWSGDVITEKAKVILSMLLAAHASKKKVSIYHRTEGAGIHREFSLISVHD